MVGASQVHAHTHTSCTDVEGACFVAVYWSERDNDQCETTPYAGTIIAMGDADAQHLGVLAPQQRPSSTAIIQYKDCSAEFLDLALLSAVGSPCTEACNECCGSKSTVVPAAGRRRMWLLKEFDTDAIRAKRHTLDAEPTASMPPRESKGPRAKAKAKAKAAKGVSAATLQEQLDACKQQLAQLQEKAKQHSAGQAESSSDDDETLGQAGLKQAARQRKRKRQKPNVIKSDSEDDDMPLRDVLPRLVPKRDTKVKVTKATSAWCKTG